MEINIPVIPAGVLTLLSFFAPYAIAILNHPSWPSKYKKLAAVIVSVVLTVVVLGLYFVMTGDVIPDWPVMILLALVVSQAAYALVLKKSATQVERSVGVTD